MFTFEEFLAGLGEDAKNHTSEQLDRLYADVQALAKILVVVHQKRKQEAATTTPVLEDRVQELAL